MNELPHCDHRTRKVEARDYPSNGSLGFVYSCDIVDRSLGWHALNPPSVCVACMAERRIRSNVTTRELVVDREPKAPRADTPGALGAILRVILIKTIASGVPLSDHPKWRRHTLAEIVVKAKLAGVSRDDIIGAMSYAVEHKGQSPAILWRVVEQADAILRKSGDWLIEGD